VLFVSGEAPPKVLLPVILFKKCNIGEGDGQAWELIPKQSCKYLSHWMFALSLTKSNKPSKACCTLPWVNLGEQTLDGVLYVSTID